MKAWLNEDASVRETCVDPANSFTPNVAANFNTDVPDGTLPGATKVRNVWTNPPPPPAPPTPAVVYPSRSGAVFYTCFTPAERIAIKKSIDEVVQEFWFTLKLAIDSGTEIDPNTVSVEEGLGYLAGLGGSPPLSPPLIEPARIPQILAGIAQ